MPSECRAVLPVLEIIKDHVKNREVKKRTLPLWCMIAQDAIKPICIVNNSSDHDHPVSLVLEIWSRNFSVKQITR